MFDTKQTCALVTGANRGLGLKFCEGLLGAGVDRIHAGARDPARLPLNESRVLPLELDVTRPEAVQAAALRCGDVTLLINNAGVLENSSLCADGAEVAARREMEINYFGMLSMVRAFAPVLARNGGGIIVNVLSVASWFGSPFMATYCASKAAASSLTDALRVELRAQGTRVIGVYAGYLDTDMAANVKLPKTDPAKVVQRTLEALRTGIDRVLSDDRAHEVERSLRDDRDEFYASLQKRWDARVAPIQAPPALQQF
jgi:NAD(P)-dependent dehydrogenase (short-subunit alcohol dehydrogenase family)